MELGLELQGGVATWLLLLSLRRQDEVRSENAEEKKKVGDWKHSPAAKVRSLC